MRQEFQSNITSQQKEEVLRVDAEKLRKEIEWCYNHHLWSEAKAYVHSIRPEILKQMRKKIINKETSNSNEG